MEEEMSERIVKSAGRALAVLELFESERHALSLNQVMALLNLPASSGSALLKSLLHMGYLEYDRSTRLYFPTMRVAVLGGWIERAIFGSEEVLKRAQVLHERTGLTVALAVRSDLHAQYLHLLRQDQLFGPRAAPGAIRSLVHSGMGLLLLSELNNVQIRALVRRIDYNKPEKTNIPELLQAVQNIRDQQYVFSKNLVTPGNGLIGAMLPAALTRRQMAIGVSGPTGELERRETEIVTAIRDATRDYNAPQC